MGLMVNSTKYNLIPAYRHDHEISLNELVILIASLWALNAFAIDMMLPALGSIARELGAINENDRQLMVVVYVTFNGFAQIFFGPLVDRFGRRKILLFSLSGYVLASLLSLFASNFSLMLMARALQGSATAATRVAAIAVVRDRFAGREMARVMSLVMTIFMAAPIVAPGIGQFILLIGPWRWIFAALLLYGLMLGLWVFTRVRESQPAAGCKALQLDLIMSNYLIFFKNRISVGYTFAGAFVFASLFSFLSASEQIFIETFAVGDFFALAFAFIALPLAIASVVNSRLVVRYGMRRISHMGVVCFIAIGIVHLVVFKAGIENIWTFEFFTGVSFFCMGLIGPNCTALAMEPMGEIAGSAGAANGFANTALSGILGGVIASMYDGTPFSVIVGMVIMGILSLSVIIYTERGVLFEPADREKNKS